MGDPDITALVLRYIRLFNEADFDAAFDCYRMPFTWLFGQRAHTVSTKDEFLSSMQKTKAALQREGVARSNLLSMRIASLDEHVALVSVSVARTREDDSEMERAGGTYLVHNDGHGWRFVSFGAHPTTISLQTNKNP